MWLASKGTRAMLTHRRRAGWMDSPGSGVFPTTGKRRHFRGGRRSRSSNPRPDVGSHKARSLAVSSSPWNRNVPHGRSHRRSRQGGLWLTLIVALDLAALGNNGLPRATFVTVRVRSASRVVSHLEGLQVHGVRTSTVVRFTTGPFCSWRLAGTNGRGQGHIDLRIVP